MGAAATSTASSWSWTRAERRRTRPRSARPTDPGEASSSRPLRRATLDRRAVRPGVPHDKRHGRRSASILTGPVPPDANPGASGGDRRRGRRLLDLYSACPAGVGRRRPRRASRHRVRLHVPFGRARRPAADSLSLTRMMMASVDLYRTMGDKVGLSTGWREVGSLRLASSAEGSRRSRARPAGRRRSASRSSWSPPRRRRSCSRR